MRTTWLNFLVISFAWGGCSSGDSGQGAGEGEAEAESESEGEKNPGLGVSDAGSDVAPDATPLLAAGESCPEGDDQCESELCFSFFGSGNGFCTILCPKGDECPKNMCCLIVHDAEHVEAPEPLCVTAERCDECDCPLNGDCQCTPFGNPNYHCMPEASNSPSRVDCMQN